MRNLLMWLAMVLLASMVIHFLFAQRQGRVSGPHPIAWSYSLLHCLIYLVLGWVLFGLWNRPVY